MVPNGEPTGVSTWNERQKEGCVLYNGMIFVEPEHERTDANTGVHVVQECDEIVNCACLNIPQDTESRILSQKS